MCPHISWVRPARHARHEACLSLESPLTTDPALPLAAGGARAAEEDVTSLLEALGAVSASWCAPAQRHIPSCTVLVASSEPPSCQTNMLASHARFHRCSTWSLVS